MQMAARQTHEEKYASLLSEINVLRTAIRRRERKEERQGDGRLLAVTSTTQQMMKREETSTDALAKAKATPSSPTASLRDPPRSVKKVVMAPASVAVRGGGRELVKIHRK